MHGLVRLGLGPVPHADHEPVLDEQPPVGDAPCPASSIVTTCPWEKRRRIAATLYDRAAMAATLSTHVLDTGSGKPAAGVVVEVLRAGEAVASAATDTDGRIAELAAGLEPGELTIVFHPPSPLLPADRARRRARRGPPSRPAVDLPLRVRELPRQLSEDELASLFEGRTALVRRLAAVPDPLTRAATLVGELPHEDKVEMLAAHPAIGQRKGLSARSAAEQGSRHRPGGSRRS